MGPHIFLILLFILAIFGSGSAGAGDLDWVPAPTDTSRIYEKVFKQDDYTLITGPVKIRDQIEQGTDLEGRVTRSVYKAPIGKPRELIFRSYLDALRHAGFEILFHCETKKCGGIRFYQTLQPVPRMRTDPWHFHYLAARHGEGEEAIHLSFLLSSTRDSVYAARVLVVQPEPDTVAEMSPEPPRKADDTEVHVSTAEDPSESASLAETETPALIDTDPTPQKVEFLDAEAMAKQIAKSGSVALYSIFFDTNSASIRAASAPTLEQVVKLLEKEPELNLIVVGHTDNVGRLHYNLQLSERRAAAMVKQLVTRYGVNKKRLRSAGVGFLAPVASNDSEEGRAKNRRVELVAD